MTHDKTRSARNPGVPRPLRIALVSEHASPLAVLGGRDAGGQNVHVAELARALAARGHRVTVYTRRDDPSLADRVPLTDGVEVVHVPAGPATVLDKDDLLPLMGAFAHWLTDEWRTQAPDLVHAHFWMSGIAALAAARRVGVPVLQTFHALGAVKRRHQGTADTSPPGRIRLEASVADDVDAVIATCRDEVAELRALGVRSGHLHVVPCGVDIQHFTPATRRPTVVAARHRLLSVGRLVPRKGVDTVVQALAAIPDADLLIAGGPAADRLEGEPEVQRLQALARRHGVADRTHFVGRVGRDAMPDLLRSADLVVATPWYEPFGIVPLEAGACARPVIASAVGGLTDTVLPGRTGLLVPPRDPGALAAAVRDLLADPGRRDALGARARQRIVAHYSWAAVAAATERVYRSVLSSTGATAVPVPAVAATRPGLDVTPAVSG